MPRTTLRPSSLRFQPRPSYPYSPGAMWGGVICTAGQVAWNERGELVGIGDVRAQTRQTLRNVEAVLAEAGAGLADVLKCTVYLADMAQFQLMNEEFAKAFPLDPPARTTVQARLAEPDMLVEIEAIACVVSAAVNTRSAGSRD